MPAGKRGEDKHQLASLIQASSSPQLHTTLCTFHFPAWISQVLGNSHLQRSKKYPIAPQIKLLLRIQDVVLRGRGGRRVTLVLHNLLSGFQGHNDEDWAAVHPSNTAAVAHEVVQDCSELSTNLGETKVMSRTGGGWKALLFPSSCISQAGLQLDQHEILPHYKASLKEMKKPCSQEVRRVFHSLLLTERKKGSIVMRTGKAQGPHSFDQSHNPHPLCARMPPARAHNIPGVARRGPAHSASR